MSGDGLSVGLFLWGTAFAFGLTAVTLVDSGRKALLRVLWGGAGVFLVAALVFPFALAQWPSLQRFEVGPVLANLLGLLIFGLLVLDFGLRSGWFPARRNIRNAGPYDDSELRRMVSDLSELHTKSTIQLSNMIGAANDVIDKQSAEMKSLTEVVNADKARADDQHELACRGQLRFSNLIKARDARDLIKFEDQTVTTLGVRLMDATEYTNDHQWVAEFNTWETSLQTIDHVFSTWQKHRRGFLDIDRLELERTMDAPPSEISSQRTLTRYKTLMVALERYNAERNDMLHYFNSKANELP
jgi:hypothetical protein